MTIFLKNELLKWQGGVRGACTLGQPWAPQRGDPALSGGTWIKIDLAVIVSDGKNSYKSWSLKYKTLRVSHIDLSGNLPICIRQLYGE